MYEFSCSCVNVSVSLPVVRRLVPYVSVTLCCSASCSLCVCEFVLLLSACTVMPLVLNVCLLCCTCFFSLVCCATSISLTCLRDCHLCTFFVSEFTYYLKGFSNVCGSACCVSFVSVNLSLVLFP